MSDNFQKMLTEMDENQEKLQHSEETVKKINDKISPLTTKLELAQEEADLCQVYREQGNKDDEEIERLEYLIDKKDENIE